MDFEKSVLIIGGGTFGLSIAYHLAKRGYSNITCIDKHHYPSPDSAGYDLNKIIRTEYDEPIYAKMGWLVTTCGDKDASDHLIRSYANLKSNNEISGIDFVETPEDLIRHVPQLKNARDISKWKGLWNPQAGWAHAQNALKILGDEPQKLGVRFISGPEGTMKSLRVDAGKLAGIDVASGKTHTASQYILCTGAASPALLPELSTQLWSKCWTLAHVELTETEVEEYRNMPIVDNHELGFFFEPDSKSRWIKICNPTQGYQFKTAVNSDGTWYSVPRYASDHPEDGIPKEAEDAIKKFIEAVLPQFSGRPLIGARICWCANTADLHFLISRHDKYPELLLGTGDSGHGFKFLPTIGCYIADVFEGKEKGLRKEWQMGEREWKKDVTRPGDIVKDLRDVGIVTEERPSCARCINDGRSCEYVLRLVWEDESSRRGIKHGRGKQPDVSFVGPTPSKQLIKKAKWDAPQIRRRYFVNTIGEDVEGKQFRSTAEIWMRSSAGQLHVSPRTLDLSVTDGMLFQYYQDQVCQTLTLVDDSSNCYRQIVLPLSISHECVRRSVLAIGALYLSLDRPSSIEYYALALQQKQRTLHQLRSEIALLNGESNNHILVAMLMLCLFDITDNCETSWATHVSAAANLIAMKDGQSTEPSLISFVSKFFATRDVMGRSACGKRAKFSEIAWENPQLVDKTVGCSSELLGVIASITDISRQLAAPGEIESLDIQNLILTIETKLDNVIQILRDPVSASPDALLLAQTSTLIRNSARIYFYTALHSALPSTHAVRCLVTEQVLLLRSMSTIQSAHLWSVFVAAIYALEDNERIFFLEQFERLEIASATRSSMHSARAIVQTVWKRRDLDADSDQPLRSDISDWVKYVRPMSDGLSLA